MRIGTWNVEYAAGVAKNKRRLRRIGEADCDIWVLTETHDDLELGSGYRAVRTAQRVTGRAGARWTTIWSRYPVSTLAVEDEHRTVAALVESPIGPVVVFGTVLPWHSDRGPDGTAKNWAEFYRLVPAQGREWARLRHDHPDAAMCVAGDLNMNLGGRHYYGTPTGRDMLRAGLSSAGLVCVTETERVPEGLLSHGPIDHVCVSDRLAPEARVVAAWEGREADGVRLSDHSGLAVAIAES